MPLYEYVCQDCENAFEVLVRGAEEVACPKCASQQIEKQFSVVAAHSQGNASNLPMCPPPSAGNCGLPQCGTGQCGLDM